jgi:hypothetical protein
LLERYIVKTLSPEEGIEIYEDARAKLASDPKILQAFRSQSRNHQLLKVAVARYDREAQLFEQLHDQYTASAPSSLGSMVSSISGGVSSITGGVSNVAGGVASHCGSNCGGNINRG